MSTLSFPEKRAALDAITVSPKEAARLSGLSEKTLERAALSGEPVGRMKHGRRVLYVLAVLESWLKAKAVARG